MEHLLNKTMDLKRSTIINDQGTEKTDRASLGVFKCRRSKGRTEIYDKINKEINVVDRDMDLYVMIGCPIQKDDKVELEIGTYTVVYTNIPNDLVWNHHIYCKIQKIE